MNQQLVSGELTVAIKPLGAEVCSIKNAAGTEFMWQADADIWARHAPVLFPVVGKLKDNTFSFEGNSYALGQHGFARDMVFDLKKHSGNACIFELRSSEETKKHFPFDFIFQISYRLDGNTLTTTYTVINPAEKPLLFSVGAHPGFNCPIAPNEKLEDYYLEFEGNNYQLRGLANGLRTDGTTPLALTNNRLQLSKHLFDNDALVFEKGQIGKVSLCSSVSDHRIVMECRHWPYFGIWAKPGQPFVCLEPWYGIADTANAPGKLEEKEGMLRLRPQGEFSCHFSVSFT